MYKANVSYHDAVTLLFYVKQNPLQMLITLQKSSKKNLFSNKF